MDIITHTPWHDGTTAVSENTSQNLEELLSPAKKARLIAATDTNRYTVIR